MTLDLDNLDLADLTDQIRHRLGGAVPGDLLEGKTVFRDLLVEHLDCSELQAEELVDTLMARGYLRFDVADLDRAEGNWTVGEGL